MECFTTVMIFTGVNLIGASTSQPWESPAGDTGWVVLPAQRLWWLWRDKGYWYVVPTRMNCSFLFVS